MPPAPSVPFYICRCLHAPFLAHACSKRLPTVFPRTRRLLRPHLEQRPQRRQAQRLLRSRCLAGWVASLVQQLHRSQHPRVVAYPSVHHHLPQPPRRRKAAVQQQHLQRTRRRLLQLLGLLLLQLQAQRQALVVALAALGLQSRRQAPLPPQLPRLVSRLLQPHLRLPLTRLPRACLSVQPSQQRPRPRRGGVLGRGRPRVSSR